MISKSDLKTLLECANMNEIDIRIQYKADGIRVFNAYRDDIEICSDENLQEFMWRLPRTPYFPADFDITDEMEQKMFDLAKQLNLNPTECLDVYITPDILGGIYFGKKETYQYCADFKLFIGDFISKGGDNDQ
jgi:hypothetical protein